MNSSKLAAATLATLSLLLGACDKAPAPAGPETAVEHAAKHRDPTYQCPMHPQVTSDEPGKCPICGMDLVPIKAAEAQEPKVLYYRHPHNPAVNSPVPRKDEMGMDYVAVYDEGGGDSGKTAQPAERKLLYYRHPHNPAVTSPVPRKDEMGMDYVAVYAEGGSDDSGTIKLSSAMVNNLGVRTVAVRQGKLDTGIQTVGTVAYDERGRIEVRVRAEGYVERLSVRAEGESVSRGQALFAVFSPKLAAAQREYLHALSLGDAALLDASAGRLQALGLDTETIARLKKTGKAAERVTYYAPEAGVVTLLGVREGALAEPGMSAITLIPISRLWVVAEVPEVDAARVHEGAAATLSFSALPGQTVAASVLEVLPQLNEATRTLQARLELDNPGQRLAAGMLADVTIEGGAGSETLMVPTEALIRTGRAERVIVALGDGRFAARDVTSGRESGDDIQILGGLRAGEEVVVSGQFMIDSESQVRSSLRRYEEPQAMTDPAVHDPGPMPEQGK
jgi:Cu(I)/Ag(I) efflux system membrane fusion protein